MLAAWQPAKTTPPGQSLEQRGNDWLSTLSPASWASTTSLTVTPSLISEAPKAMGDNCSSCLGRSEPSLRKSKAKRGSPSL